MQANRIHNFNPGPAALPLSVLEEIQANLLDFQGSGMSITEISHRSRQFDDVVNDAVARTKRLLGLDDNFEVERFLKTVAVDLLVGRWDNYWQMGNNYYLYFLSINIIRFDIF